MASDGVRELIVLSGKGGTGKTTFTASFAAIAGNVVLADCDVDAADLHVVTAPVVRETHVFTAGHEAVIDLHRCTGCGLCADSCRFDAIRTLAHGFAVDSIRCEGCGLCVRICPEQAIGFPERTCGEWMVSDTRFGPMVHARLRAAGENSGKLVTLVRNEAHHIAVEQQASLIISDGPPGIGCPVIASITGSTAVLLVAEPSLSGLHDLERVGMLARRFDVPVFACVNKADIDRDMTDRIAQAMGKSGCVFVGTVDYDEQIVRAQLEGLSAVEYSDGKTSWRMRAIWEHIWTAM